MFSARSVMWQLVAVLGLATVAYGWSDDFGDGSATDGNPVFWVENLGGPVGGVDYFPGIYDASSGDYKLDPDVSDATGEAISVSFVVAAPFADTYVRSQGIIMPDPNEPLNNGGNFVLLGRINPDTLDSYLLYVDVNDDGGGTLELQAAPFGFATDLGDPMAEAELDFGGGSEIILELNIVGNQLSGYAWQPGQSKPATPQVTHTETVYNYASGLAGIAYQEDDANTFSIHRYVSAQDTPFVDEPPVLDGDYNEDGTVNAADYSVWRDGGSPDSTQAGYDLWKANFGSSGAGSGGSAAVPEPVGLVWLAVSLAATVAIACSRQSART